MTPATDRRSLVDELVQGVHLRILSGELQPGQRITEGQLAEQFGVSRTPVREAVTRLAELGLLHVKPRSYLEVVRVSQRDLAEINALRAELESFALRLVMERGPTDNEVRALAEAVVRCEEQLEQGPSWRVFVADSVFHLTLAQLSGNAHLGDMLRRLDVKVQLCRVFHCVSDEKIAASVACHRQILQAIVDGDRERAQQRLREHIEATSEA